MDYSHNPYVIYVVAALGMLLGVMFLVGAVLAMRSPRGGGAERRPGPGSEPPAGPGGA